MAAMDRLEGCWIRVVPRTTIASTITYSPMDLLAGEQFCALLPKVLR
jgi:hypothetical protein